MQTGKIPGHQRNCEVRTAKDNEIRPAPLPCKEDDEDPPALALSWRRDLQGEPVNDPAMVFLISTEAADLLRISRRTLERMRVDGTGPRYLKVGPGKRSRVLYRQSELLAWLERQTYGSTSEYNR